MLVLPKKIETDKKLQHDAALQWRPDFRDIASLPDTKTVRTSFFINTIAGAIVGALTLFVFQKEWTRFTLTRTLSDVENRIAAITPNSEKAQLLFKQFLDEQKKFNEAQALVSDSFRITDYLVKLGSILPDGVGIKRVEYRASTKSIQITGSVRGLDAAATNLASKFEKILQDEVYFSNYFSSVRLTNAARNLEEGNLNLELVFTFKNATPPPKVLK